MRSIVLIAAAALGFFLISGPSVVPAQQQAGAPTFADVSAIIEKYHCTLCHGTAKTTRGLSVETYESLMKGSEHGPVVIPRDPAKSELIQRLKGQKEPRMPFGAEKFLSDSEIQTIEKWIAAGAQKS